MKTHQPTAQGSHEILAASMVYARQARLTDDMDTVQHKCEKWTMIRKLEGRELPRDAEKLLVKEWRAKKAAEEEGVTPNPLQMEDDDT